LLEKKFKGRVSNELEDNDAFFEGLPETTIKNLDDMEVFSNYVKSDMYIEVIRFLKFNAAVRFITHPRIKVKLSDVMIIDILSQDEE
jgi:hypothetical protein